jgi:hypothetical protein
MSRHEASLHYGRPGTGMYGEYDHRVTLCRTFRSFFSTFPEGSLRPEVQSSLIRLWTGTAMTYKGLAYGAKVAFFDIGVASSSALSTPSNLGTGNVVSRSLALPPTSVGGSGTSYACLAGDDTGTSRPSPRFHAL